MAIQISRLERNIQRIVDTIIQLVNGRGNYNGVVTLTAGAGSTTVKAPNCSAAASVQLTAQTANAAAALATTYILAADVTKGQFIITHANNAQTDRTFSWIAVGG